MRFNQFAFLLLTALSLAGCQSGTKNIAVSPDSELSKQMLEMDAKGRAYQNAGRFSQAIRDFETARGGDCTDLKFVGLQEPGLKLSRYVRLYMMEASSPSCGSNLFCAKVTFTDSANTVAKRAEILFGPGDVSNYQSKAAEFVRYAQAGNVQQMMEITSSLTRATQSGSVRTVYADQVVPQFQGAKVTWNFRSIPNIDEKNNVGLLVTGTAQGKSTFSFDLAVFKENGKFVVTNIQKHH